MHLRINNGLYYLGMRVVVVVVCTRSYACGLIKKVEMVDDDSAFIIDFRFFCMKSYLLTYSCSHQSITPTSIPYDHISIQPIQGAVIIFDSATPLSKE